MATVFLGFLSRLKYMAPPSSDCMQLKPKDYFRAPAKKEEEEVAS